MGRFDEYIVVADQHGLGRGVLVEESWREGEKSRLSLGRVHTNDD